MKKINTKYWELFLKQKNNSISSQEMTNFNNWKDRSARNLEIVREFELIYTSSEAGNNFSEFNPKENWNELHAMIKVESESKSGKNIRLFPWFARVAAAAILILGFTFIYYQYSTIPSSELNLQSMVQTDDSGIKMVELTDGSTVWLNHNSELLYPEAFQRDTRTLYLKGEGFFDVKPDPDKPFIVHSGSSKTTVLGTSFNLRAYGDEEEVKLTVVTGKVSFTLADDKEKVIVTPGNNGILRNETMSISQSINEDLNFLSWKTGELIFNNNLLSELVATLERHYDTGIEVENPETLNCRFTGNFQDTELENAVKVITRATGTSYTFTGDHYTIHGSGCN